MGKKLFETLSFLNTPQYCIKNIDLEPCIYRKISDNYDIEISGLNSHGSKFLVDVYVWDISRGSGITATAIEKILDIKSKEELQKILNNIVAKYQ